MLVSPAPKARTPHRRDSAPQPVALPPPPRAAAGQASGKRTLAEVMERDMAAKRQRRREREAPRTPPRHLPQGTRSKFFSGAPPSRPRGASDTEAAAGPSSGRDDKENVPAGPDEDALDEGEISVDEGADPVVQEEGYMSPEPDSGRWDSPELSSPLRPRTPATPSQSGPGYLDDEEEEDDFGAEVLSSPPGRGVGRDARALPCPSAGTVLVHGTPTPREKRGGRAASPARPGPDLRDVFEHWSGRTSDIDEGDEGSMEGAASASEPETPESSGQRVVCVGDGCCEGMTNDVEEAKAGPRAAARVANGWWERWACAEAIPAKEQSVRARPLACVLRLVSKLACLPENRDPATEGDNSNSRGTSLPCRAKRGEAQAASGSARSEPEEPALPAPDEGDGEDAFCGPQRTQRRRAARLVRLRAGSRGHHSRREEQAGRVSVSVCARAGDVARDFNFFVTTRAHAFYRYVAA